MGKLMIIGGAEKKTSRSSIIQRFCQLAGGRPVIVITTATDDPETVGEDYRRVFREMGCRVEVLPVETRKYAESGPVIETILSAGGVFFTGGDQLKLTAVLGGSKLEAALWQALEGDTVLAGTSAGASVMSETMIIGGDQEAPPRKGRLQMSPGMGFLPGVVVDQHFAQRGRLGRLVEVVAQNPGVLGLGIDEDTAVEVEPRGEMWVLGSQAVTIVDGSELLYSNVSEQEESRPLAVFGIRIHILPESYGYHLRERVPLGLRPGIFMPASGEY